MLFKVSRVASLALKTMAALFALLATAPSCASRVEPDSSDGAVIVRSPLMTSLPRPTTKYVFVSVDFDDGYFEHLDAARKLHDANMPGTFFIVSGALGSQANTLGGRLTCAQVVQVKNLATGTAAHEIGAHTYSHTKDWESWSRDAIEQDVFDDFYQLNRLLGDVSSFAYPRGDTSVTVEEVLASPLPANYETYKGRSPRTRCPEPFPFSQADFQHKGIESARRTSTAGSLAEVPPNGSYALESQESVRWSEDLAALKKRVRDYSTAGVGVGWAHLIFHRICPCSNAQYCDYNARPYACITGSNAALDNQTVTRKETFEAFVDFLQNERDNGPTDGNGNAVPETKLLVRTPRDIIGLKNPSLERTSTSLAECWTSTVTANTVGSATRTSGGHQGHGSREGAAVQLTLTSGGADANVRLVTERKNECMPIARASSKYLLGAWVKSASTQPLNVRAVAWVDDGTHQRLIGYGAQEQATGGWTRIRAEIPWSAIQNAATEAGITSTDIPLRVGVSLFSPGTALIDDLSLSQLD